MNTLITPKEFEDRMMDSCRRAVKELPLDGLTTLAGHEPKLLRPGFISALELAMVLAAKERLATLASTDESGEKLPVEIPRCE